jgi:hypothetical protein
MEGKYKIKTTEKNGSKQYFLQDGTNVYKVESKPRKNPIASPLFLLDPSNKYLTGLYKTRPSQSIELGKLAGWYRGDYAGQKYIYNFRGEYVEVMKYSVRKK